MTRTLESPVRVIPPGTVYAGHYELLGPIDAGGMGEVYRAVDKRADIWAFGRVLFEMLTGRAAFPGKDLTEVLAAVIRAEPE